MDLDETRSFVFKTEEQANLAMERINSKFPSIAHIHSKNAKVVCTIQPISLTEVVVKYVGEELGGKMKGFSLTWA